ncbi:MAG: HYR domain-containing protein [Saprospiraceae bacterium]|nr:HYR domain-containing protein [Saprospiraceae bacterium]
MTRLFLVPSLLFLCALSLPGKDLRPTHQLPLAVEVKTITPASCYNQADGAIELEVLQGLAPFAFKWSNGADVQNASNLPAGVYSVTITDADNGEVVLLDIDVQQPTPLIWDAPGIQSVDCLHPTGALTVAVSGGTPGYTYQWNNGQSGPSATGLAPGTYTATVTDANACSSSISAVVAQDFTMPMANAGPSPLLLCSNSMVQLQGSASGGANLAYAWTALGNGHIASGANTLQPTIDHSGTYSLQVTNTANGCTALNSVTIASQHEAPTATAGGGTLRCNISSVTLQSSYSPLHTTFGWSGPGGYTSPQQNPVVSSPGNYIFSVTDTLTTCVSQAMALVGIDTIHPSVSAAASGVISCLTPTATLTASSATAGAGFLWTGPNGFSANTAQTSTGAPGLYSVKVTNPANGCSSTATATVRGNTTPPVITASASGILSCVTLAVTLNASVQPANATYQWTGPNGFSSNLLSPVVNVQGTYIFTATSLQNNCQATTTVTVLRNATPPDLTALGGIKTCANPTVTLHANTNTPNLSFVWSGPGGFSSTLQHPVVSTPGFYTVVATNPANGCSNSVGVNVSTNYTVPVLLAVGSTITCANPIGKPVATSTTPGATFLWSGPNGFSSNIPNPQVTLPGFYSVVATNPVNGCTTVSSVLVSADTTKPIVYPGEPQMLNCLASPILLSGFGSSSGTNFSYLWTTFDGHIVSGIYGLYPRVDAVGTYTLRVTNNSSGCVSKDSVEITQAPPVSMTITPVVHVLCNGSATGSATAKPSGGNGSYTYGWSNGGTQATAASLLAGYYSVTVSDTDGCSTESFVVITQPSALQAMMTVTPQTINNVNNGTASASPSGGTIPYTYKWSNNSTTAAISGLAPGTYTVTITDSKGCTLLKSVQVNAINCTLSGTLAATPITCSGAANGSITANISGGTNPLQYKWSNNAVTKTISALPPATYTVTVTDATACTLTLSAAVSSPAPLVLSTVSKENVPCIDSKTGSLSTGVTGGTTPYVFAWSNGSSASSISGLSPGVYSVTATDSKGCSKSLSESITVTDLSAPQLILKNATVTLDASGHVSLTPAMFDNGSFDAACSITALTVSPLSFDCSQLGARIVTLTATDTNGNSKTGTAIATVTDSQAPVLQCPESKVVGACQPVVSFALPQVTDNCPISPSQVQQTAGLSSGAAFPVGKTLQTFTYTDAGGLSAQCSFEITVAEAPSGTVDAEGVTCPNSCDGSAVFTSGSGTTISQIQWSNGQSGSFANGLCAGTYELNFTDSYGCSASLPFAVASASGGFFEISSNLSPATCSAACDGVASISVAAGAAPFGISWSNGQIGETAVNLCAGSFSATVTDALGCSQVETVQIQVVDAVAPTLQCPGNMVAGTCATAVAYNLPTVQDNCPVDPDFLQLVQGLPSGGQFPQGQTTQIFQYTDAAGNSGQCSFTVTVAAPASLLISGADATCANACNGMATLSISGGLPPFSTQWSNGQSGLTATQLCAGNYAASVTDGAGCLQSQTVSIAQPAALSLAVLQVTPDVNASGQGSIDIEATGGTPPYSFLWMRDNEPFAGTQNLSGLLAGLYQVTVTDAHGCALAGAAISLSNTTAIREAAWASGLQLYPNPAVTQTRLVLAEALGQEASVRLLSVSGVVVQELQLAPTDQVLELDCSALPAGFWLVHIRSADGQTAVRKLKVN